MTIIEQVPEATDAKQYIEANRGIKVEYVDNIDDILKYDVKPFAMSTDGKENDRRQDK